jgi:hypothetical protein
MAKIHQHKALLDLDRTFGWSGCVKPGHRDETPHGNIIVVDYCRCGALRASERNAGVVVYGPWGSYELPGMPPRTAIARGRPYPPRWRGLGGKEAE